MIQDEPMPPESGEPEQPDPKPGTLFHVRVPEGVKGRAVRASRKAGKKLTPWIIEAIVEKCDRELGREE